MRLTASGFACALVVGASIVSCSEIATRPNPAADSGPAPAARADAAGAAPAVVISQVYGGGGNSGASWTNDFIELFNLGTQPVSVDGWSVQYASATGWTWQVTPLAGTIPAGGYYLVQEAKGAGGTTALPAPDASGSIAMSATAGKVVLVIGTSSTGLACPNGGSVVDRVSFGSATNCGTGTTAALSNTTAAIRKDAGCAYTPNLRSDFVVAAPAPRSSATPVHVCGTVVPAGPLDHVTIGGGTTVLVGGTTKLTALAQDTAGRSVAGATITWSSSDAAVATVDTTGLVTGVAASGSPVTITATATAAGITKSAAVGITVALPGIGWIDASSSASSFPPGFQTQLFATARVSSGGTIIPASFTFEALDPGVATIAPAGNTGIITGVAPSGSSRPRFRITATPLGGGTPYSYTATPVTIESPIEASPAIYADNDEFGDPTPASASGPSDMLIARPQYTLSYNQTRGTPNWVSYELDARQTVAGQDRCNCFTADPLLPPEKRIFTSDYTDGGYDRGHMTRSADRTAGNVDNASTFYLTNIIPQTADLNQGVWANLENALADSARAGRAVYIVTGPLYSRSHGLTFLKGEDKVAVPDSVWKVALIGPGNGGAPFTRASLQDWSDLAGLTVVAVIMPNVAGVRNDAWTKYLTTVDQIEAATGYDLLSLLALSFQDALEAGDHAPVPDIAVSGTANEGSPLTFDGSATADPDLGRLDMGRPEALTYAWDFSDGGRAAGAVVTRSFADDGIFTATLTVTDAFGWEATAIRAVGVANVAPTVSLAAATPLPVVSGDSLELTGSFSDPGADAPWQAVFDWGAGARTSFSLNAPGSISARGPYLVVGNYTATFTVTDKDGAASSATLAVAVVGRSVNGSANPRSISATETDGDIKVTLYSAARADVTTLDLASVAIAGVPVARARIAAATDRAGGGSIVLRFARRALIAAGVLTPATSELLLTGTLASGVRVVAHVPVNVH